MHRLAFNNFIRRRYSTPTLATFRVAPVFMVPQNHTPVFFTFGRLVGKGEPGLQFQMPGAQQTVIVSNEQMQLDIKQRVMTSDNAFVQLVVGVQLRVPPESSADAIILMQDPMKQVCAYIESAIRAVAPEYTLDMLFKQSGEINEKIELAVGEKLRASGFVIESTQIISIEPDKRVVDAMNNVVASLRERDAAENVAKAQKTTEVLAAEARRDADILRGQGIAGQREEIAKGLDRSVQLLADNLGIPPIEANRFLIAIQKLETMEKFAQSNNTKTVLWDTAARDPALDVLKGIETGK
jgi:regulator of protease activity HflC (stomatin/prohibitin superfamily)